MSELAVNDPDAYGEFALGCPYPNASRQKLDLFLSSFGEAAWALEFKLLRILGDNGGLNDNMAMHIFSPYPQHRSAITDCEKLTNSGFDVQKGIVIIGYESRDWPLEPALQAFEVLARHRFKLSPRFQAEFSGLIHPVHTEGKITAWQLIDS